MRSLRIEAIGHRTIEKDDLLQRIDRLAIGAEQKAVVRGELNRVKRRNQRQRIEKILDLPWGVFSDRTPDVEEARSILDGNTAHLGCGMAELAKHIAEYAIIQAKNPKAQFPSLELFRLKQLNGNKDLDLIGRLLGRPVETITFNEIDNEGTAKWMGLVLNAVTRAKCQNPVIVFRIGKESFSCLKVVHKVITRLVNNKQSDSVVETFFGVPFDLSNVLFVFEREISELKVCKVLGDEMHRTNLFSTLTSDLKNSGNLLEVADLQNTIYAYTLAYACKMCEESLESLIAFVGERPAEPLSKTAIEFFKKERDEEVLEEVQKSLIPFQNKFLPIGGASILAANDEFGIMEFMQSSFSQERKIIHNTEGNASMVNIAYDYCRNNARRYGISPDAFNRRFTVEYPRGDGLSAGCATLLSLFSLFTNRRVRNDSAVSGVLGGLGIVTSVGGIYRKTRAAYNWGKRRIVLPITNKFDVMCITDKTLTEEMQFVYVETIDELVEAMMENDSAEEQSRGNYRVARDLLFTMTQELKQQKIRIPAEMVNNLMLIHSYLIVKMHIKRSDQNTAARLLIRVADNISRFPSHTVPILTATAITCLKAGLRQSAFNYAVMLLRPENRRKIDEKYRKRIEAIVRKQERSGGEVDNKSVCPHCDQPTAEYDLTCSECKNIIPYCVVTGRHIVADDFCLCPSCAFPAIRSEFIKLVDNNENCPMCGNPAQSAPYGDAKAHLYSVAQLNSQPDEPF